MSFEDTKIKFQGSIKLKTEQCTLLVFKGKRENGLPFSLFIDINSFVPHQENA